MNDVIWTPDQQNAIDHSGSSLLISAAAGSGKTAVLVERIIRLITEERRDITEFLIITYTKAAAGELRKKISRALRKKIKEVPESLHLRRQLALLGNARISTVHSFCSWVLRNYGNSEDIPSVFRVLDEAEEALILKEILTELIDEKYDEKDPDFLSLATYMNDGRSDRLLFSSLLELFKKSRSHPYPTKWLDSAKDAYNTENIRDITETVWGRDMVLEAKSIIKACEMSVSALLSDVDKSAEASGVYHDALYDALSVIRRVYSDSWDELFANVSSFELGRLPSSRTLEDKTLPNRISALFKIIRDDMKSIPENLMQADSATLLSEISALSPIVRALTSLTSELSERFSREKLRRGVLDYSDLEHLCINLLLDDYDSERDIVTPSAVGRELSESFSEILLDEFQDSNIIQDVIFRSVSRDEKNIIMVGDVKQSIYGFRLADPSIFMKKYKTFKRLDEARGDEPRVITLSQNFRSRNEILDTANGLFSRIMTENLGGVDYTTDHYLYPRKDIPELSGMQTEFCLIDYRKGEERGIEAEARFCAAKISELVKEGFIVNDKDEGMRPCRYSDFAVLLRSASSAADAYEHAFSERSIPFISPKPNGLLQKSEVSAVVSLLSVVDNPTSDIPLIAALKSPMFAFSADDLCEIRRERGGAFINSMEKLAKRESAAAEKCRDFLAMLKNLRSLSRGMSASSLIWEIYNRTNALGMFGALPYGKERQQNLLEFYKCAEEFESLGYSGLYKFISHIANLIENDGDIAVPKAHARNAVTIMTMHKSKGLEFPIVFVGNVIRSFNLEDIKNSVLIHPELGIGMKLKDEVTMCHHTTLMREAIRRKILAEQKSEEMRLLYVALTRAREKMFITASRDNTQKKLSDIEAQNPYPELDAQNLARRNDAALWFLIPLLRTAAGQALFETAGNGNDFKLDASLLPSCEIPLPEKEDSEGEGSTSLPCRKVVLPDGDYPYSLATKTPSKLTATRLGSIKQKEVQVLRKRPPRPSFIREKALTPAERGTALHMAMQFVDFTRCATLDGAKEELSRLYNEKFLTKAQVESISPEHITAFLSSDIGRAMETADKLEREFKFSVLLPATELLDEAELEGEEILLQGVIDMYFEKDGEITIVDFKTDRRPPEGELLAKYTEQLHAYRRALFEMTGKTASKLVLYLVPHGRYIEV